MPFAHAVPATVLRGMLAAAALCAWLPAQAQPARCPGCGVVEGIRPLQAAGGNPAGYEFTVRLRDGSLRTSTAEGKASWRVGDRIILMGGNALR